MVVLLTLSASAATKRARLRRPRHGVQIRVTPFEVPARAEREVCQAIQLDNDRPIDIEGMRFATPDGPGYISHHFTLFVDDDDALASLPQGPVPAPGCVGFGQSFGAIIGTVQAPRAAVEFPPHVGFTLQPHQILLMNLHYINGSDTPLKVNGAVNLLRAPAGSIVHHAHGLQIGTLRIDVPPGQNGIAEGRFVAPFPMNLVLLSTHSHKHTTAVDLNLVRAGTDAERLLETVDYEHPTVRQFATAMRLETGDGLHWTCHYTNDTATTLHFGITSEDEMCFTIGAFYLDDDAAPLPAVPGCSGGNVALTCLEF